MATWKERLLRALAGVTLGHWGKWGKAQDFEESLSPQKVLHVW
jgi:hypothetical protein